MQPICEVFDVLHEEAVHVFAVSAARQVQRVPTGYYLLQEAIAAGYPYCGRSPLSPSSSLYVWPAAEADRWCVLTGRFAAPASAELIWPEIARTLDVATADIIAAVAQYEVTPADGSILVPVEVPPDLSPLPTTTIPRRAIRL